MSRRPALRAPLALFTVTSALLGVLAAGVANAEPERSGAGLDAISAPAARQAAEHIACGSPATRRYLRRTLADLEARRWGTLTANLEGDTIDLVADAVYAAASAPGQRSGDVLRRFIGEPAARCQPADVAAARQALARPEELAPETEVDRCAGRPLSERRKDPACALAASVRSALDGDVASASGHVADVVAAATFDAIYTGKSLSPAQVDALFEHVAYELREVLLTEQNDETIDADVLHAFAHLDLDAVRGWRCKDAELVRDLAEGPLDSQDAFCSATRADFQPEKVDVTVTGPSGEARKLNLTGLLDITIPAARGREGRQLDAAERDARVAEALLCEVPLAAPDRAIVDCSGASLKVTKPAAFKLEIAGASWTLAVTPKEPRVRVESVRRLGLAALVDGASEGLRLRADIGTLIRDKLLGEEPTAEAIRELATVALRLRRVARALDDVVTTTPGHAYILAPLEALPALVPRFGPDAAAAPVRCDAATKPLDRMRCAATGPLRGTILAAEDASVRELAVRVAALASPRDRASCGGASSARMLEAFAANVPE
ncbi:MAG TPA: hypothetical protein VM204_09620, partial [Gaiellaceae bacterium]|nr:hypothetical protein [Gaiellaceae bacterium]